jgi:multicomponent Na+:H+ antiporter subunit E
MSPAAFAASALIYSAVWWALAEGRDGSWTVGAPTVLVAAAVGSRLAPVRPAALAPLRWLRFAGWFLGESLRAGWQVARLAFGGRAGVAPAVRELRLERLDGRWATLAGYVIALVPGTCTVDLDDRGRLTLHALVDGPEVEAGVREVERRIERLRGAPRGGR